MTKRLMVGTVPVGGGAPVSIQSMCNTKTGDVEATVEQILRLEEAGCEIVRVAVPDLPAARPSGPSGAESTSLWWRTSTSITDWRWSAWTREWIRSA